MYRAFTPHIQTLLGLFRPDYMRVKRLTPVEIARSIWGWRLEWVTSLGIAGNDGRIGRPELAAMASRLRIDCAFD